MHALARALMGSILYWIVELNHPLTTVRQRTRQVLLHGAMANLQNTRGGSSRIIVGLSVGPIVWVSSYVSGIVIAI